MNKKAGLNPMVGLYASFCIAIVTAFAGGRPGLMNRLEMHLTN